MHELIFGAAVTTSEGARSRRAILLRHFHKHGRYGKRNSAVGQAGCVSASQRTIRGRR